jgi:hypothetical protein
MPIIAPELKHDVNLAGNINTAECILESSLQLYEAEFERAYRIMKKVGKGKMALNDLFGPYETFMTFSKEDTAIKPDSGYQFAIVISVETTAPQDDPKRNFLH